MLKLKKKRIYTSPKTEAVQSDLEGLLCTSTFELMYVDELHNINEEVGDAPGTELYFEF